MPLSIWYCHLPPDSSPEIFTVARFVSKSAVPEPVSESKPRVAATGTVSSTVTTNAEAVLAMFPAPSV